MITYGDLYDYLENQFAKPKLNVSKIPTKDFEYTQSFCKKNNINADRLLRTLYDFGGGNDIEILLNVVENIPHDTPILSKVETPVEFAISNNYYTRFHEGMWVRCKKNDTGSVPDLNTAYIKMFKKE